MLRASELQARLIELQEYEADLDDDERAELAALLEIDDLEYLATDGAVLIAESEFEDYARSYAEETTAHAFDTWPFYCIDWEYAANELQHDFTVIEYAGQSYYTRG